jgi:hypothetical protein
MRQHLIAGLIAVAGLVPACAQNNQYLVRGTDRSVGVDGVITIKPQSEDVNVVSVELVNLPPPERHDKAKKAFVVWITATDGTPIRAGRLTYDSQARIGTLQATTPNDQVFVQVTAEEDSAAPKPSDFVLISKHVVLKRDGNQGEI